jgi:transcriptional regulator with XRE-family HTH domain
MLRKYIALGDFIKAERKRRDISQIELAASVQITNSMLSMTESGKARPGPDTLDAIAKQLDLDANVLRQLAGYQQIDPQTLRTSVHSSVVQHSAIDTPRPLVLQALRILLRLNDESLRVGISQLQALESLYAGDTKDDANSADDGSSAPSVSKRQGAKRDGAAPQSARKSKR